MTSPNMTWKALQQVEKYFVLLHEQKIFQLNFSKVIGVQESQKWILLNDTLTDDRIIRETSSDIRSSQNDATFDVLPL